MPFAADPGRRQFLKQSLGLSFCFSLGTALAGPLAELHSGSGQIPAQARVVNAYVNISPDGVVRIFSPPAEMGQGTLTSLPLILAEEMDLDWENVEVAPSPAFGEAYGDPLFLNMIFTTASRSVSVYFQRLRLYGAQARRVLLDNAAAHWQVAVNELDTDSGVVVHRKSGRRLSYGEIAAFATVPPVLPEVPLSALKPVEQFRLIGKDVPRRDVEDKVFGRSRYSIDISLPDMVYAVESRAPIEGSRLAAVDDSRTLKMPGVLRVLKRDSSVAVVADSYFEALQARATLDLQWTDVDRVSQYDSNSAIDEHMALARDREKPGFPWDSEGDISSAFSGAERIIEREYQTDYLYHAAMEPLNAVVWVKDRNAPVEVWAGTQAPPYTVDTVARVVGVDRSRVILHRTLLGGSFGRRSVFSMDFVEGAAWVSAQLKRPVKMIWSREDDFSNGHFKPMSGQVLRAAISPAGEIRGWHHRVASEDPLRRYEPLLYEAWGKIPLIAMLGAEHHAEDRSPLMHAYELPHRLVEHLDFDAGIRIYAMRGVGAMTNKFAIESFIDEVAQELQRDPAEFRLDLLKRSARAQQLVNTVVEMSDWYKPRSQRALGLAYSHYGDSLVASVVEISLTRKTGRIKVHRVWVAADVGIAIQPDNVVAQIEGGCIYGLSNALTERISIKNGRVQETNFHQYELMRMHDAPEIIVRLLPSSEAPTGIGEAATVLAPAALANAFARLSGTRIRRLPLSPAHIKRALNS